MFIKSIVLDGFKSYGNRVEVTGFDPAFNAITGLNGSGKSNILDSICFVLGITNLSNVRAGSLQELIYKHGQAGITKATVSITFDNRDKNQCPMGYENHDEITVTRQVVMGGKNKYLINGINVQNKRVNDLFCSVQLNVNNPHFLIMQGRITKVLNMKPPEILSMVEEAAGTRMYEAKKQAAQKTIEKKDAKLRELNDIIKEDIAPKLQKLQDERSQYQEYQKVVRELENLTRLYVAWKYVSAEESAKEAVAKVTEVENDIQSKKDEISESEKQAKDLDKQVAELSKKLDEESGAALRSLETELQTLERQEAGAATEAGAAEEALSSHRRRAALVTRALRDDEAALADKQKQLDDMRATFESLRTASEQSEAALGEAQHKFVAVSSGMEDASASLQDRLMAAKQAASEASTRISQNAMERKHAEGRLATLEREAATSGDQFQRDQEDIGRRQRELDSLNRSLSALQTAEQRRGSLVERVRALQRRARAARDGVERAAAPLQRCQFRYRAPQPGFDHTRVLGTVCRLFKVKDPTYCNALEAVAGGRLYNPVVDTEVTSKLLLDHGNLQERTTFIPLNKISGHVIDRDTVRRAQQIVGADNVELALNVIEFDERVRPAMAFVFGGTLVCRDMRAATRLAADVRRRCVTLLGDSVDPAGTMGGGALAKSDCVLLPLMELRAQEQQLQQTEAELQDCQRELAALQHQADQYAALSQRQEELTHELAVLSARLASTAHAQLHAEIQALRERVSELGAAVEQDRQTQREQQALAADLELKVKDIKGHRDREFKKAESALAEARAAAERHGAAWRQRERRLAELELEVGELRAAVLGGGRAREDHERAERQLGEDAHAAREKRREAEEAVKEMTSRIKRHKSEIAKRSGEVSRLVREREKRQARGAELQLAIEGLQYKVKELQAETVDCDARIKSLEKENPWISSERQYFGLAGGLYDFGARQAGVAGQRLQQLRERRDKLARGLNARAHTLLGKEEDQYQDVMRKKKIVEADRAKLVQVMAELDEKKKRTLVAACEQVNRDFGSIFSSLLPGAQAKLRPPDNLSVLDGLEIKVGFNNTWKESLGELSGGQRSLVALSLVLAMLLHKPAPLYILDEVDAALDLSHTQNIGQMLRDHFHHSQFIIVSLKDGMFNNANVLFRTRFVDGMSTVQRTVNARR